MLPRLPVAVLGGLGLWVAFPGYDLWPLAVAGIALLTLATAGAGPARGALTGLVGGLAFFVPLLSWTGIYVGATPWLALAGLQACYVAVWGLLSGYLQRHREDGAVVRPVAVALAWSVVEFARATTPFGGFAWGRLAYSQADAPVVGAASLVGAAGVSFLVALAGAFVAAAVGRHASRGVGRRLSALVVAAACLLAPAWVPRPVDGEPVSVLGVQGNVPEMSLDFNAERRAVLDNHVTATVEAAALVAAGELEDPDVVLWPENASDIDPLRNEDAAAVIAEAVEAVDAPLVVGAVLRDPGEYLSNASLLYVPGVGVADSYTKQHPVPFAEHIPHRGFFRLFSDKVDLVARDFVAGERVGLLSVPLDDGQLGLGVAICFEIVVDDLLRSSVEAGAELMLVPTNNATFGFTDESVQQLAVSRVKAIELGRSVVHISTVGVSGLITPDGAVRERTELFTQDVVAGELPRRDGLTWAVRLGGWLEWAMVAALAVFLLVDTWRRVRVAR